jgi:hypothetical protein
MCSLLVWLHSASACLDLCKPADGVLAAAPPQVAAGQLLFAACAACGCSRQCCAVLGVQLPCTAGCPISKLQAEVPLHIV